MMNGLVQWAQGFEISGSSDIWLFEQSVHILPMRSVDGALLTGIGLSVLRARD